MTSPICSCDIDLEVYSLVLEVLKQGIVCREPMPLLPFERGIQIVYVIRLKRGICHLAKVCNCLGRLDSYKNIRLLSLEALYNIRLT